MLWFQRSDSALTGVCCRAVVDAELLTPPVNALRLALSPAGLGPRIVNYGEWSDHLLDRLRRQVLLTFLPADAHTAAALHRTLSPPP